MYSTNFDIDLDEFVGSADIAQNSRPYTSLLAGNGDFQDMLRSANVPRYECPSMNAEAGSFHPDNFDFEDGNTGDASRPTKGSKTKHKKDRKSKKNSGYKVK